MKIIHVMGARQNFVKITSIVEAIEKHSHAADPLINQCLIHIGQHVVERMSKLFFDDLGITKCGINRDVGSGAHVTLTDGTNFLAGMHKEKIIEAAHACLTFPQLRSERRMNSFPMGRRGAKRIVAVLTRKRRKRVPGAIGPLMREEG